VSSFAAANLLVHLDLEVHPLPSILLLGHGCCQRHHPTLLSLTLRRINLSLAGGPFLQTRREDADDKVFELSGPFACVGSDSNLVLSTMTVMLP
jgi:hypothetical protein